MLDMDGMYGGGELLSSFYDDLAASNNFVDTLFETNDVVNPAYNSCPNSLYNPPETLNVVGDIYPKRQKIDYNQLPRPEIVFDGYCGNSYQCPELRVHVPVRYSNGGVGSEGGGVDCAKKPNGGNLSAQSVAARLRRRKISEKTQELGKLIPGGNRMNTAEMFQAAYKYVKFLKAQIEILQLMGSFQVNKSRDSNECNKGLEVLLASPTIQEKFYSVEKCLVPREFVVSLAKDDEIKSNPLISKEVDLLLGSKNAVSTQAKQ